MQFVPAAATPDLQYRNPVAKDVLFEQWVSGRDRAGCRPFWPLPRWPLWSRSASSPPRPRPRGPTRRPGSMTPTRWRASTSACPRSRSRRWTRNRTSTSSGPSRWRQRGQLRPARSRHPPQGRRRLLPHPRSKGRIQSQVRRVRRRPDLLRAQEADPQQHGPGQIDDPRDPRLRSLPGRGGAGLAHRLRLRRGQRRALRPLPQRRDPRQGLAAALVRLDPSPLRGRVRRRRRAGGARRLRGRRGQKQRPQRPRSADRRRQLRRRGLVRRGRGGRRPRRDDPDVGGRALRRPLGRLLAIRQRIAAQQLLPAQRRGGALHDAALGHRPDLGDQRQIRRQLERGAVRGLPQPTPAAPRCTAKP